MIRHKNSSDLSLGMADHNECLVIGRKDFILGQRTIQSVNRIRFHTFKLAAKNSYTTFLFPASNQARIHNIAFIRGKHQCRNTVSILVGLCALKSCGKNEKNHQQKYRQNCRKYDFSAANKKHMVQCSQRLHKILRK